MITLAEIRKRSRKLKKSNEEFMALSAEERRIEIAKEVLKWIPARGRVRFVANQGIYVRFPYALRPRKTHVTKGVDLGAILSEITPTTACIGCAKGAFFIAKVAKFDGFSCGDFAERLKREDGTLIDRVTGGECQAGVNGDFPAFMFDAMEQAFEQGLWNFGMLYPHPRKRIRAIAKNIIRNGGEFLPVGEEAWFYSRKRVATTRKYVARTTRKRAMKRASKKTR